MRPQIILYNFVEERSLKQRFLKYDRSQPNKLQLIFNNPVIDSLGIYPLNFEGKTDWLLEDPPIPNDTMNYWITDTSLVNKDSLKIILTYPYLDSLQQLQHKSDTVNLVYKEQRLKGRRGVVQPKYNKLSITFPGANKQAVDLNDKLYFEASEPLISVDLDKISLVKFEDTLKLPVKFTLTTDSQFIRRYYLNFPLEPNYRYQLIADTMAFTNIYHQNSDSIGFQFRTQKDDYYGRIFLTVDSVSGPVIVQILNEKDDVLRQLFITQKEKLTFDYLAPGKYKFKVIHDWNNNKKWDTGNWGKRLEPEPVEYFDKVITVRSNWDDEEEWELLEK